MRGRRGSPNGGAWLSFQHLSKAELDEAFGPIIKKLSANNIDLTKQAIEVAPIAHYHMGGIEVNESMETCVKGLLQLANVLAAPMVLTGCLAMQFRSICFRRNCWR